MGPIGVALQVAPSKWKKAERLTVKMSLGEVPQMLEKRGIAANVVSSVGSIRSGDQPFPS